VLPAAGAARRGPALRATGAAPRRVPPSRPRRVRSRSPAAARTPAHEGGAAARLSQRQRSCLCPRCARACRGGRGRASRGALPPSRSLGSPHSTLVVETSARSVPATRRRRTHRLMAAREYFTVAHSRGRV
jgi:hypothetical protein